MIAMRILRGRRGIPIIYTHVRANSTKARDCYLKFPRQKRQRASFCRRVEESNEEGTEFKIKWAKVYGRGLIKLRQLARNYDFVIALNVSS